MHAIYEESGKFLGGRILSEADASAHLELDSGKRVKVKTTNLLLRFEKPAVAELLASAQTLAQTIELDLAWEFAPEGEFGFVDLAVEYFGGKPDVLQQAAALIRLFDAPHYFRRAGKGRFKKAPADIIQQALAAIQKKQQLATLISEWAAQLGAGQCPPPVREQLFRILFKPDKNAPEYKAVVDAARASQLAPLTLLRQAGAIASAYDFHWNRFLFDQFPKGTGFPALEAPAASQEWPVAEGVNAFSIDDSQTTEIDDALSVRGLGSGQVVLGIHIAAPGLAFGVGSPLDTVGRNRLSTVYMPGYKITMLPDSVVQAYTLQEGRLCPALSLYATFDEATLALTHTTTRIERVNIAANLRHDQLDTLITEDWLTADPGSTGTPQAPLPNALRQLDQPQAQLAFLFRLARQLKQQREIARGKPELFNRPDYNFRLERPDAAPAGDVPRGDETVVISTRQRGAPLDLIVAEAMILANSTWGQWLADCGVPGIYRSQHSMAPGMKVRMGTKALPHAGMGVKCYAWSTSPLRRYVDLVNQWQIIACVRHGTTAALAAPFKPKDADLFSIISSFDTAYSAYNAYQSGMERYWTLKYLEQNGVTEITAAVIKEGLVRADTLPLVLGVMGTQGMARGTRLTVRLGQVDLMGLEVSGTVLEVLTPLASTNPSTESAAGGDTLDAEGDDDDITTGGLTLALDIDDAPQPDTPTTAQAGA